MSFSNTTETHVLNYLLTNTSVTRPTAWYVALYTAAPSDSGGGTELSGSAYARQSVAFTVSGDTASNTSAIEFPAATGNWGTITHAAVFDASSGGNMLAHSALTASKTIENGDVFRITAGSLDITLD
jgi:hypothetical protein